MHARVVAPAAGARWLLEGWRIFRAAPLGWVAIVMAYLLIVLVASSIPGLGIAAIALATPGFSVSFMAVSRSASAAGTVHLGQLFSGFREGLRGQLLLGLVYFACVATAISITAFTTGTAVTAPPSGDAPEPAPGARSAAGLAWFLLLYVPTMMAFWFAPVLAAWHSIGVAKSLFFSFMACLMNWRAFLAYGAVLGLLVFAMSLAASFLASLLFPGMDATRLVLPILVVVYPSVLASYYASYRDVFAAPSPQP